ncbi:hypothetical protein IIC65_02285, partial [Candidatus Sumerlaeota bacterium]|nr:hypothetical protein [Candidatus Sumerlaeota bacterium]
MAADFAKSSGASAESAPGAADPPSSSPRADIAKAAAAPAESVLDQISRQMRSAERVQVIGHTRADGDCLGSLI